MYRSHWLLLEIPSENQLENSGKIREPSPKAGGFSEAILATLLKWKSNDLLERFFWHLVWQLGPCSLYLAAPLPGGGPPRDLPLR